MPFSSRFLDLINEKSVIQGIQVKNLELSLSFLSHTHHIHPSTNPESYTFKIYSDLKQFLPLPWLPPWSKPPSCLAWIKIVSSSFLCLCTIYSQHNSWSHPVKKYFQSHHSSHSSSVPVISHFTQSKRQSP